MGLVHYLYVSPNLTKRVQICNIIECLIFVFPLEDVQLSTANTDLALGGSSHVVFIPPHPQSKIKVVARQSKVQPVFIGGPDVQ